MGIIALSSILLLLLVTRAVMPFFVSTNTDPENEKKLQAAWAVFSKEHPANANDTAIATTKEHQDEFDDNPTPLPDSIDLNTADSALLVRLRGIGPVTAGKMVAWRKKHGDFTGIEQIKETGGFAPDVFDLLRKHLVIRPSNRN